MVLKNINYTIEDGSKTALVGPSGCGKSTCIQLMLRYYDPNEGRILLDGHDLKEYDLKYLREKLGLVSQQPYLFSDTVRNNVVMGMEESELIEDHRIEEALD